MPGQCKSIIIQFGTFYVGLLMLPPSYCEINEHGQIPCIPDTASLGLIEKETGCDLLNLLNLCGFNPKRTKKHKNTALKLNMIPKNLFFLPKCIKYAENHHALLSCTQV